MNYVEKNQWSLLFILLFTNMESILWSEANCSIGTGKLLYLSDEPSSNHLMGHYCLNVYCVD